MSTEQTKIAQGSLVIGLVGGVASGKSMVAEQLAQLGAGVLDADGAGHEVLQLPEVQQAARQRWGAGIFASDGKIDRAALAKLVFGPSPQCARELEYLEQLTHPRIGRLLKQQAAHLAAQGKAVIVLDAAVMLKSGWDNFCDRIVFVDAPRRQRLSRTLSRGWSEKDFDAREAAQEPLTEKRRRADVTIDNSGSPDATKTQVERFWHSLVD